MAGRIWFVCPKCGRRVAERGRCGTCPPTRQGMRTTARGYGADHQRVREQLLPLAIGKPCPLCLDVMYAHQALDLDHTIPGSAGPGDRITHARCNRSRGDGSRA